MNILLDTSFLRPYQITKSSWRTKHPRVEING
jgi:hypothetical protein